MSYLPICIFGIPRSGTTWVADTLSIKKNIEYVHEPDNERHTFLAYFYKRGLERFPYIRQDEQNENYYNLFDLAFYKPYFDQHSFSNKFLKNLSLLSKKKIEKDLQFYRRNGDRRLFFHPFMLKFLPKQISAKNRLRIVKSVHAILSLPFIIENFNIKPVVIIRHPASVISSYLKMNNPDINRGIYNNSKIKEDIIKPFSNNVYKLSSKLELAGAQVGIFYYYIQQVQKLYPFIKVIEYEDFCIDFVDKFKALYDNLNIEWAKTVESYLIENNKRGSGYDTQRVAEEQIDVWKKRLNKKEVQQIQKGYSAIPSDFYKNFL